MPGKASEGFVAGILAVAVRDVAGRTVVAEVTDWAGVAVSCGRPAGVVGEAPGRGNVGVAGSAGAGLVPEAEGVDWPVEVARVEVESRGVGCPPAQASAMAEADRVAARAIRVVRRIQVVQELNVLPLVQKVR